jgi:hypothetical protein
MLLRSRPCRFRPLRLCPRRMRRFWRGMLRLGRARAARLFRTIRGTRLRTPVIWLRGTSRLLRSTRPSGLRRPSLFRRLRPVYHRRRFDIVIRRQWMTHHRDRRPAVIH